MVISYFLNRKLQAKKSPLRPISDEISNRAFFHKRSHSHSMDFYFNLNLKHFK